MKNNWKVDYYARVHLFWVVLLFVLSYQLSGPLGDYIVENNLYDFQLSQAGEAGIRMATVYLMIGLLDRKGSPVIKFCTVLCMYFLIEIYPAVFKNASLDYWRFAYLGLAGLLIWKFDLPFRRKYLKEENTVIS